MSFRSVSGNRRQDSIYDLLDAANTPTRRHQRGIGAGRAAPDAGSSTGTLTPNRWGPGPDGDGESVENFTDVREELDRIGHNLTSVLNNPRESVFDMLYEALDPEQAYAMETHVEGTPSALHPEVDLSEVVTFLKRTGSLSRGFVNSHQKQRTRPGLGTLSVRPHSGLHRTNGSANHRWTEGTHMSETLQPGVAAAAAELDREVADTAALQKAQAHVLQAGLTRCFEEVPSTFFDPSFNLQEPAVFEKLVNGAGPMQQERLTHYLDLVEVSLLGQISARSDAFLEGLETTHALRKVVSQACTSVQQLRAAMARIESEVVTKAIRVPQLAQRQQNLMSLQGYLELVQSIERSKLAVEPLLAADDYSGALDVLEGARRALARDLSDMHCLRAASRQMSEYEDLAFAMLTSRLLSVAQHTRPGEAGGHGGDDASEGARGSEGADLEAALVPVVQAVERLGKLEKVLDMFEERLLEDLKLIIRTVVGDYLNTTGTGGELIDTYPLDDSDDDGGGDGGTIAVSKLKTLEHSAFLDCLALCFEHVLAVLQRAVLFHRFMASRPAVAPHNGSAPDGDASTVASDTKPAATLVQAHTLHTAASLRAAADLVERSLSQLVGVRRDLHATSLSPQQLRALCDAALEFTSKVEALCGSSGSKLRVTLLNQTKAYVECHHDANKTKLVDVSPERQAMMDHITGGHVLSHALAPSHLAASMNGASPAAAFAPQSTRSKDRKREALLEGARYKAVWSTLLLVEMAYNQLRMAAYFPAAAPDVLGRLSELLRLYNARTMQLVLGAGAIQSASRLRSISAKHLALCAHSLGLVRALVPHMRAAFAAHLPRKHQLLLVEMERVSQEFGEHHEKILAKFVSIIQELVDAACPVLREEDWDKVDAAGDSSGAVTDEHTRSHQSQFMGEVVRGVSAMHKVLQQQLPPEQLKDVFSRIFSLLNRKIPECFAQEGVQPATAGGRQRILDDTSFMATALSTLWGVDGSNLRLEDALQAQYGYSSEAASEAPEHGPQSSIQHSD
ncbi:Vps54-like protein-domain-containing protein, partial [Tribonema minus]